MKYFFDPGRRFVTFASIMNNNPKSPTADLQQQQLLLRMEYEYEKEGIQAADRNDGYCPESETRSVLASRLSRSKLLQFSESACNRYYTYRK